MIIKYLKNFAFDEKRVQRYDFLIKEYKEYGIILISSIFGALQKHSGRENNREKRTNNL